MTRIRGNPFPCVLQLKRLTPGITVDTDDLEEAFFFTQNINSFRSTSVGDILHKSDNTCWYVDLQGFTPLLEKGIKPTSTQQLPHLGKTVDPDVGDLCEIFPTLDLDFQKSQPISTINFLDRFRYLEARQWQDGSKRLLLRSYN